MTRKTTFRGVAAAMTLSLCGAGAWADDGIDRSQPAEGTSTAVIKTVERPTVSISPQGDVSVRTMTAKPGPGTGPVIDMGKVEKVTDRYPNGKVRVEREVGQDQKGNYVNQGNYKAFDQDGQVIMQGEFLNGKQNGKWTQRFTKDEGHLFSADGDTEFTGPFTSEATFLEGQLHGLWTIKDSNGQSVIEFSFDNGIRNGNWTWFHPNGRKRLEAMFKSGMLNGDVQEFDREEKPISKTTYVDGKLLEKVTGWYTVGQKRYEGYYLKSDDMPEATYEWWNSKVTTTAAKAGPNDQKHGVWISWYPNGAKQTEAQYDRDVRVGKFKWFYENGTPEAEGEYDSGKRIGTWITWHPNGLKESQGDFKEDRLISKWFHWDADGKMVDSLDSGRMPNPMQPQRQMMPGQNMPGRQGQAVSSR
jgi:antitoxin component YwqK of YwqJK toxin-antitoxin module